MFTHIRFFDELLEKLYKQNLLIKIDYLTVLISKR